MSKHFFLLFLFFLPIAANAQAEKKDSLLQLLQLAKADTNKVYLLLSIADQFDHTEPRQSKMYVQHAVDLSRQLNFAQGLMKGYRHYAYLYSYQGRFDSVLYYNKMVLVIANEQKDLFNIGAAHFNIGVAYRYLFDLDSALKYTLEGARLLEGKGYLNIESTLNDGLQSLYMTLQQYEKAIQYGEKAVMLGRKLENKQPLVNALNNLGLSYIDVNREEDAKSLYKEALAIAKEIEFASVRPMLLNNLSDIEIRQGHYEQAKVYAEESLAIAGKMDDAASVMNAKAMMACYFLYKSDFKKAEDLAMEVKTMAEKESWDDGKIAALGVLAKIAFATGEYSKGFSYETQKDKVETTVFNESVKQREAAIRLRFETEKKDNQIFLQQATIKNIGTLNYILTTGAAALFLILFLSYRSYRNKQKLQQQKIETLEAERKLTATEAVLKGEEQERTRLAKDLHDGLGGMLSGIKYSLNTMKGNLIMTPENAQAFERSIDMLDTSISEMRRVAHNMMPEALVKFGLDTALKDFCTDINNTGAINLSCQTLGLQNGEIEQTTAISIYRIVQELINNSMKHAAAKNAIIQVSKNEELISVTVEDDGKGFDTAILKNQMGIGWLNIKNRVELLKGKLDVQSTPESGTSVHIELKT